MLLRASTIDTRGRDPKVPAAAGEVDAGWGQKKKKNAGLDASEDLLTQSGTSRSHRPDARRHQFRQKRRTFCGIAVFAFCGPKAKLGAQVVSS